MRTKIKRAYYGLIVLTLLISSCYSSTQEPQPFPTPRLAPASLITPSPTTVNNISDNNLEPPKVVVKEGFLATILPQESVDIAAKFEGRLEAIYVGLGDQVSHNTVVAKLESYTIEQDLVMAKAALQVAEAEQHKAILEINELEDHYNRRIDLVERGIIAQEQLLEIKHKTRLAEATLDITQARILQQTAQIRQLEEHLANTFILSPFEGTVSVRYQSSGAIIGRGTPIINVIKSKDLRVRFMVPAQRLKELKVGTTIKLEGENLPVPIRGIVENISPEVDSVTQIVFVEGRLITPANYKEVIKPGLTGQVAIITEKATETRY